MNLIKLNSGATASLHKSLLQNKIIIRIKTFHGTRKIYPIEVRIEETVDQLREKLLTADTGHELSPFKQIRLVHTIVKIMM